MNCRKCGAPLRREQKVCIACGTPTPAGGNFYVEEDKKWTPTPIQKYIGGGVILILLILLVSHLMHIVPPDEVAKRWFDLLVSRQVKMAQAYVTPELESDLQNKSSDLRSLSDDYFDRVVGDRATSEVSKPTFDGPTKANVAITLTDSEGSNYQINIEMIKQGRRWLVNKVK